MTLSPIDVAIEVTIGKEGKYSNNKYDSGGETMWGITGGTARKHGYTGKMIELPRELAVKIYKEEYFIKPGFADVFTFSPSIGAELFDSGVNCGPWNASVWLQRCLNILNRQGELYSDIKVDGEIGTKTLTALSSFLKHRGNQGELVLLRMLNSLQGARYVNLAETREKDEEFIFGWFLHRVVI